MLRNIIYAVLLGAGMAACLSQNDKQEDAPEDTSEDFILADTADDSEATPAPALFVVGKQHVGNIKIGMPIEQVRQHVPDGFAIKDTTLRLEGMQSTAYVLHPKDKPKGILVEQQCEQQECRVWRISVLSPDFRTGKGVGVGSKYGELQKAYSIRTVTFEEGNLVALAPAAGMSFMLDHSSLPTDQLPILNASTVPANVLVRKILIY
ncbi:mechanosensitive ion channel protein MscS [Pontibacter anaerobius]|uniref:Mechanosensitive ion channel protein MscS n=1 Tax=Pontibacter anaerobius TaxID=2993940 RepID=A0ABT3RES1_9BACT|nr:mechanosensitive ion channel protein MscS [Pontibacter anaerobius]MCX2739903.1 mechanosensitive ion channel protein MscS [Pontibacter anaerobius]